MECSTQRWMKSEFSNSNFGDLRLDKRYFDIIEELSKKSESNVSSAFESWKEIKACYRFIENKKVTIDKILSPHTNKTIERIKKNPIVLLLQDTTYIDYSERHKTKNLDLIGKSKLASQANKGLMLHTAFAVTPDGLPLGILNQSFIERKSFHGPEQRQIRYWNNPIEDKESHRWVSVIDDTHQINIKESLIVHIADREGDIYELYRDCVDLSEKFIIRAKSNRSINKKKRREAPKDKLFDFMEESKAQGKFAIKLQSNGKKKYRTARLSLIYKKITIPPPPNKTKNKDGVNLPMVEMYAIMAIERNPPKNVDALNWLLLTNFPINDNDSALEKIKWYSQRWNIEIFHKILKSGCSIENAQFRNATKLKKYIVLKSIVAWRLFWLTRNFEENGDKSYETVITKDEMIVLQKKFEKLDTKKTSMPTVKDIYIWIGKLGGFIGRKSDIKPGVISIWKGWIRFSAMIDDYYELCG